MNGNVSAEANTPDGLLLAFSSYGMCRPQKSARDHEFLKFRLPVWLGSPYISRIRLCRVHMPAV